MAHTYYAKAVVKGTSTPQLVEVQASPTSATHTRFCQISERSRTQIFVFIATSFYIPL